MSAKTPKPDLQLPPVDPFWARWLRRAISCSLLMVFALLYTALLPLLVSVAAAIDLLRKCPWSHVRFVLALAWGAWMHVAGLVSLWGSWILGGRWLGRGAERQRELDHRAQCWWAQYLWRGAAWIYVMRLELYDAMLLDRGGFVMMSRHASILDTILPVLLLAGRRRHRLRYVVKRELLWDPCIDIAGDRLPTAFVRRHGREHATEVARVEALLDDLGPHDVVVFYPEGTRFSAAKRERVLRSLARKQPEAARWAESLRHVLPPHPGGSHVLLEPGAHDVVFCAHTGLEPANHVADLLKGSLLGAQVKMQFWRVPAADIPTDPVQRERWLRSWWERVDRWIESEREPGRG